MKQSLIVAGMALGCAMAWLTACASAESNSAAAAVEAYIKALVAKNPTAAINASCPDWEDDAKLEADSFAAVEPTLQGLACTVSGSDGNATLVTCQGVIKVTYNNEQQELSLADRAYVAVPEGGEWRMCGYQ